MGKYFESALTKSGNRKLLVGTDIGMDAGFFLEVQDKYEGNFPICFENYTAPSLALSVLEEAGCEEDADLHATPVNHFGLAMFHLRMGLKLQERANAEAKEWAELEAEALELVNAWRAEGNEKLLESWDAEEGDMIQSKSFWLAVARRARELNKEENNA